MTAKEFFDLVRKMRALQREYENFRNPEAHRNARRLEKTVDEEIERVDIVLREKREPKLF